MVGFGGGSAMDLAKLVAVLPGSGQTIHDVVGAEKVGGRQVALVQVPTTSGTGSEGGTRALVTDPATQNKLAVQSRHMLADLAVVDPDLTMTVPPHVTAATGIDAMAHCVEAYTSRKAHPLVDLYALEGIRLVGRHLARAVRDGSRSRRPAPAWRWPRSTAASASGRSTRRRGTRSPIRSARAITCPTALACALIFPHTLAFNAPAVPERTAAGAGGAGPRRADRRGGRGGRRIAGWCAELGIEMRLSGLGVPEDDLPAMADEAHAIRRLLDNNPRDIGRDEILALYRAAY